MSPMLAIGMVCVAAVVVGIAMRTKMMQPIDPDDGDDLTELSVRLAWYTGQPVVMYLDSNDRLVINLNGEARPEWLGERYAGYEVVMEDEA